MGADGSRSCSRWTVGGRIGLGHFRSDWLSDPHRMNLIDRYLLAEWLKLLGLLLAATLGLLLMTKLYDDLRDLFELGVATRDILHYFAAQMPSYLSVVLPL